jgi:outer membrane protein
MKPVVLFFVLAIGPAMLLAQQPMQLSLHDALNIAREKSALAKSIKADYKSTVYQYQSFRGSLKPQLSVNGFLPTYDSRLDNVIQPDGSYKVQNFSRSNISTSFLLEQNIFWTGGSVFISSDINQFTNRQPTIQRQWQTAPFAVGIRQPLSLYNSTRWNFKQEKLRMTSATKRQIEDFEDLSLQITQTYFDLYLASMELLNAQQNEATNDTLYKISTGRFNVGKIAENELLQVELQLMNAKNAVTQSQVRVDVNTKRLRNLLGLDHVTAFELLPVNNAPIFAVEAGIAIKEARENRSDVVSYQLQENEAKMGVQRSKSNQFASGDIFLSYGLNQTASSLSGAYKDPLNASQVRIGYSIPLIGFGKNRNDVAASKQRLESVQAQIDYNRKNFDIEVENAVNSFNQLQAALIISAKSDTIAQKRFELAKNRYLLGKISITDLGLAQDAKDKALIDYIRTLQQYWTGFYMLRRVTLYDFEKQQKIQY